jgi:hypothetical protein
MFTFYEAKTFLGVCPLEGLRKFISKNPATYME